MDESWQHGVLHGGLAEVWDRFWLAESYMLAGNRLIDIALENEEVQRLFYPAIYNYRHAMELYLKAVLEIQEQTHDLSWLFTEFEIMMKAKFNQSSPTWFTNLIATFIDYDPGGTSFRYGGSTGKDEVFIDFRHVKRLMGWACEGFRNVRRALGLPDAGF